jgi:hypothetical protein
LEIFGCKTPKVCATQRDLVSDALPYSPMWYRGPKAITDAVDHAKFFSRSHAAVVRIYDQAGKVIATHEHAGDFKE